MIAWTAASPPPASHHPPLQRLTDLRLPNRAAQAPSGPAETSCWKVSRVLVASLLRPWLLLLESYLASSMSRNGVPCVNETAMKASTAPLTSKIETEQTSFTLIHNAFVLSSACHPSAAIYASISARSYFSCLFATPSRRSLLWSYILFNTY